MKQIRHLVENRPILSVERGATVQSAAEFMAARNIGAVPVMDGDRLVGVFSERDIISRVVAKQLNPQGVSVAEVMTREIVVAGADEAYESGLKKMKQARCRHLPVVDDGQLLGMISLRDLLQVDINEKDDRIEFLTDYMFHVSPEARKRYPH